MYVDLSGVSLSLSLFAQTTVRLHIPIYSIRTEQYIGVELMIMCAPWDTSTNHLPNRSDLIENLTCGALSRDCVYTSLNSIPLPTPLILHCSFVKTNNVNSCVNFCFALSSVKLPKKSFQSIAIVKLNILCNSYKCSNKTSKSVLIK